MLRTFRSGHPVCSSYILKLGLLLPFVRGFIRTFWRMVGASLIMVAYLTLQTALALKITFLVVVVGCS